MTERAEQDMLSWLHCQILARKGAAEALPHGPWHVEGRYPQSISNAEAVVIAQTFEGPQFPPSIAEHIVAHDPRDTIARCEAELTLLSLHESAAREYEADGWAWDGESERGRERTATLEDVLRVIASGYRHLPGWRPEWAPESAGGGR